MSYRANMEYEDPQVRLQQWVVKNKERLNALCVTSGRGAPDDDACNAVFKVLVQFLSCHK